MINGNLEGYILDGKFAYESTNPVLDSIQITGFTLPGNKEELIGDHVKNVYQKGDSPKSRITIKNNYNQNLDNFACMITIASASFNYEMNEVRVKRYRKTSYALPSIKYNVSPGNIPMQYTESISEYDTESVISSEYPTSKCWRSASLIITGEYPSCAEKVTIYNNDGCEGAYAIIINVESPSVNACVYEFGRNTGLLTIGVMSKEGISTITETFRIPLHSGMISDAVSI